MADFEVTKHLHFANFLARTQESILWVCENMVCYVNFGDEAFFTVPNEQREEMIDLLKSYLFTVEEK